MTEEAMIYEQMRPEIEAACEGMQMGTELFRFEELTSYSSVYFGSLVVFRIRCRGKKHYLAVPAKTRDFIPVSLEPYSVKSDEMVRIPMLTDELPSEMVPIVRPIVEETVKQIGKEFDCCSRCEECSDAGVCVRRDFRSYQCGYRKILREGRIFFGKNRNV